MRRAHRLVAVLLAAAIAAGCAAASAQRAVLPAEPPLTLSDSDSEAELGRRLIGRWEGEVDMTMSERTLVIGAIRRHQGRWLVESQYGVTGVNLTPVDATLDTAGGTVRLRFVTLAGSPVGLTLQRDGALRGGLRVSTEQRERPIELKRVSTSAAVAAGSTA